MSDSEQELLTVVRDWDAAMVQNDADAIGRFMAEEWTIVGSDGHTIDKQAFLQLIRDGTLSHNLMQSDDLCIRVYGSAALVTGLGVSAGTFQERPFREVERQSNMFVRQGSQWRCVLTHLSRVGATSSGPAETERHEQPGDRQATEGNK